MNEMLQFFKENQEEMERISLKIMFNYHINLIAQEIAFNDWKELFEDTINFFKSRACPHFNLSQISVQAIKTIALKFRANFSNRVAMLRKCFSLANKFSIRCLILYKC